MFCWGKKLPILKEYKFGDRIRNKFGRIGTVVDKGPAWHPHPLNCNFEYRISFDDGEHGNECQETLVPFNANEDKTTGEN